MNKIKWLVSTLICTYNAEKFFRPTIESVIDQTYRNQEILIRDDGSTDNTIDVIKEYQKKDKRIKLWTSKELWKKLWSYWWLNFLIDKSNWEFIAIQDHDDIWHPEKLERQVNFMNENKDYVACGVNSIYIYYHKNTLLINKVKWNWYPTHTSLMYRNNWYRYDLKDKIWLDNVFMMKTLKKIYILPYVWVIRRYFWTNLSFKWQKQLWNYINFYKRHKDIITIKLLAYNLYRAIFPNLSFYLSANLFSKNKYIKLNDKDLLNKLQHIYWDDVDINFIKKYV